MNDAMRPIPAGVVLTLSNRRDEPEHERRTHEALAQRLATLLDYGYGGAFDPAGSYEGPCYLLPSATLVGAEQARRLGVEHEGDLFGGVVPQPFVATKAISHPLVRPGACAPEGWSSAFAERIRECVLPGYTVFSLADAREAGRCLLERGPLRVKPVLACAGRGQHRVEELAALDAVLAGLDAEEMRNCGLVLETHLEAVQTVSVGQVRLPGRTISYHGTQQLTTDNQGESVYGGSELVVVEGGFDALLALELSAPLRLAVIQARTYDDAASACFPGFLASRRNYDVALGMAADGRRRSGVLEQSWRVGGASSAEIAALEAFARSPGRAAVRAASIERYGEHDPPVGACVLYRGRDPQVGMIGKYVVVENDGGAL